MRVQLTTDEEILRERERFDRSQKLIAEGKVDEARKLWWWPKTQRPPKKHWSRNVVPRCYCGRRSAYGSLALCQYCGGATDGTPSLILRH